MTLDDITYSIIDIVMLLRFNGNYAVTCILIVCKFRRPGMTLKLTLCYSECQKAFDLPKIKADVKNRFWLNTVTEAKFCYNLHS